MSKSVWLRNLSEIYYSEGLKDKVVSKELLMKCKYNLKYSGKASAYNSKMHVL